MAAAAGRQAPAAARDGDLVDPVFEWLDDGDSYLLRLKLPEFKKEDFRVQVDPERRLTVLGRRRPSGPGDGQALRVHKAFQLPDTADVDAITGRFDGAVLTLTVPKLQQRAKEDDGGKPADDGPEDGGAAAGSVAETSGDRPDTERRAKVTSLTAAGKEEAAERKPEAAPPADKPPARGEHQHRGDSKQEEEKARAAAAAAREKVAREAARRIELARARVAEAKAKAERERTLQRWKERAAEEGLKLAEAIGNRKEVVAAAVAAFTLGVFVSQRFCSRN